MTTACLLTVHEELTVMTLPAALKQVGEEAFLDDSSMQYVILGEQVADIGARVCRHKRPCRDPDSFLRCEHRR